uniref:NB-ARC domain-containing protein n=1 Tax=Oryza glumipatula TaxID=40148 RepID=A0A0D9ZIV8_9ORYZ
MEMLQNVINIREAISTVINIGEASKLEEDLSRLQVSLDKARAVIYRGEWGRFKNKDLAALLWHLKDATYDAEDLLRESNDQVLRQKMEDADRSLVGQLLSSSLNGVQTLIGGSKTRIKEVQDKLNKAVADLEGELNSVGLNFGIVQHMPATSSVIGVPQVFGRDEERDLVIEKLGVMIGRDNERDLVIEKMGVPLTRFAAARAKGKRTAGGTVAKSASTPKRLKGESSRAGPRISQSKYIGNVSILPIFGIGGVGKTTLAQYIYNDERVSSHIRMRTWVCVSDLFDKKRIIEEIFRSITKKDSSQHSSNDLQEELKKKLKSQKFLLVLDDIWSITNREWEELNALLKDRLKGSMILVTTRLEIVANLVCTNNFKPFELKGLDEDKFWNFFKDCAFGQKRPADSECNNLHEIGQSIASRLCGSPLAAKTLGRLLNMELTVRHWETIEKSELWELPHQENEILPALQLSYLYLPRELKRCFAFCSMFPKDYSFERDEIVDIWVAESLVELVSGERTRPEDIGIRYLDDLRSRFLLQSDPKYPDESRYVMHDLIHDMAQSVSVNECLLLQDLSSRNEGRKLHAVRHMSVQVADESLKSELRDIQYLNKLHSLRFGINLKGCKLVKLPESIGELHSLRYLDISHSRVKELPEKFWRLYSLQVVDASRLSLRVISPDVTKLINLRRLALPADCALKLSVLTGLGNLSRLRNLRYFTVAPKNGREIGELKDMDKLSGTLTIKSICNVKSKEEASEARLVDKQYLKALDLQWRDSDGYYVISSENGVLEGLRPPRRIERLKVKNFRGDSFCPSWFKPESLPTIRSLELFSCHSLKSLSIPSLPSLEHLMLEWVRVEELTVFADDAPSGSTDCDRTQHPSRSNGIVCFRGLTSVCLVNCRKLRNLDQFLSPDYLPSIKSIEIRYCISLVSVPSFVGFGRLQDLKIWGCYKVYPQEMVLPSSLQRLSIGNCGELDRSFPTCLQALTSLTVLHLDRCKNMESIPIGTNFQVQYLLLKNCLKLSSIGGAHALSSLRYVSILECPELLHQVQQPFERDLMTKDESELLHKFLQLRTIFYY